MTEIEITKNLLLGKSCSTCKQNFQYNCPHQFYEYDDNNFKKNKSTREMTCLSWINKVANNVD